MTRFLFKLGRASARHPFRVLGLWLIAAMAVVGVNGAVGGSTIDDFSMPGTESQRAVDLLESRFPAQAGARGQVVFHAAAGTLADPAAGQVVSGVIRSLEATSGVVAVDGPVVAPDGRTGFVTVSFADATVQRDEAEQVLDVAEAAATEDVRVEVGGTIAGVVQEVEGQEGIGLAVAVIVLLLAFGSVIAMGIPIGSALFGIFVGLTGVGILSGLVDVPSVSPMLATMIGLGVGIDYALFVVTRHRQFLHDGWPVADAAGRANATAGQAVLFAGATVVVAICGLFLSGIPAVGTMGLSSGIVVAVAMIAAVTLLPALLGLAGHNIDRLKVGRRHAVELPAERTISGRWAHRVGSRPWPYAIGAFAVLATLAAPVLGLRVGFADDGNGPKGSTAREAYDLLAGGFGPGFNAPLIVVAESEDGRPLQAALPGVAAALSRERGIVRVDEPAVSASGDTAVLTAYPATSPQDRETVRLVHRLRDDTLAPFAQTGVRTYVAGWTASGIDVSERLIARTPVFIAAVVVLSFLLLMMLFRSVLVPLKAAVMNLLSIGASYGLLVAVFQWGWGKSLIGLHDTVPILPFVPMIMFAILFGLSMDYEVFLLSRVREEYVRTGDSHRSVVDGLSSTARVITSAALIMISVFGAFIFSSAVDLKMFGLGLAAAVLIDATIVRMVLVPATMALLGSANWWLPGWLDRLLPHVDVEGGVGLEGPPVPEAEPVLV